MNPRIEELFERAAALEPDERARFLETCGEHRTAVEELLELEARAGDGFLSAPAAARLLRPAVEPGDRIGAFTVERLIASGGSGLVFAARQEQPERAVALKIMHGLGSENARRHFLDEAEVLGRLRHPGIAHVYAAGVHGDVCYIAMELVPEAVTLDRHAAGLSRRDRVSLLADVCDAAHHAHLAGVVHGDLKPSNLLVTEDGRPKLIDFGIARAVGATAREVAGTPAYMSPEQREFGGHLDARADVYAVGVVLREFVAERDPELDAVASRAVAADRADRYPSAAALAADLRRWRRREPVEARPRTWRRSVVLFVRRRTALATALAALLVALVAGTVTSLRFAWRADRDRAAAVAAGEARLWEAYVAQIAAAQAALRAGDVAEARERLVASPAALRGWEWHHLRARLDQSASVLRGGPFFAAATSADGSLLAAIAVAPGRDELWMWRVPERREILRVPLPNARAVAIRPDGAALACGFRDGTIRILDASGRIVGSLPGHTAIVNALAYSPDGAVLATASTDRTVRLWRDAGVQVLRGHVDRVICLAFLPGGRLASGGRSGTIRVWDVATGTEQRAVGAHQGSVEGLATDGTRLVSCSRDRTVRVWDLATWRCTATGIGHDGNVRDVALSPDGGTVVSGGYDRTVRLWDVATGRERACLRGHADVVRRVACTERAISVSADGSVRFWPLGQHAAVRTIRGAPDTVDVAAFSPDGRHLATGDASGRVSVRAVADWNEILAFDSGRPLRGVAWPDPGRLAALRDDGRLLLRTVAGEAVGAPPAWVRQMARRVVAGVLVLAAKAELRLWDAAAGRVVRRIALPAGFLANCVAAAADGATFAAGTDDGRMRIVGPRGHRDVRVEAAVADLAFSDDGRWLAAATGAGALVVDLASGAPPQLLGGHRGGVSSVTFGARDRRLATAGADGTIRLWDAEAWRAVAAFHHQQPWVVLFDPEGRHLVSGASSASDNTLRIWSR